MKRNPNGYGSVTRLSGNRAKPYVVRITMYDKDGTAKQRAVGYAESREEANIMLAQYNKSSWLVGRDNITLSDLYKMWSEAKRSKLKKGLQSSLQAAYGHCAALYGVKYRNIRAYHIQSVMDSCNKGYSTQAKIKGLFYHLDKFAYELDIIDKMYSTLTSVSIPQPETNRTPFTAEQIKDLWAISNEPYVDTVLIYIYTGFRLMELLEMELEQVDTEEKTLKGGLKTEAGKNRIVPIHTSIYPFIKNLLQKNRKYLFEDKNGNKFFKAEYYKIWHSIMKRIGANKTVHEARHTFETILDNAGANRRCIDLLMGHKSKDVGNRVYNHKTIEQLRVAVEMIKIG